MPVSRREFGQSLAAAALSMSVQPDGVSAQATGAGEDLCYSSAVDLAARLRKKDISARDVMSAHLTQIERTNPRVNAIVTLVADRAMADAARADETMARRGPIGVLHGLPVAVKDILVRTGFELQEITRDGALAPYHTDRNDGHAIWVEKRS